MHVYTCVCWFWILPNNGFWREGRLADWPMLIDVDHVGGGDSLLVRMRTIRMFNLLELYPAHLQATAEMFRGNLAVFARVALKSQGSGPTETRHPPIRTSRIRLNRQPFSSSFLTQMTLSVSVCAYLVAFRTASAARRSQCFEPWFTDKMCSRRVPFRALQHVEQSLAEQ